MPDACRPSTPLGRGLRLPALLILPAATAAGCCWLLLPVCLLLLLLPLPLLVLVLVLVLLLHRTIGRLCRPWPPALSKVPAAGDRPVVEQTTTAAPARGTGLAAGAATARETAAAAHAAATAAGSGTQARTLSWVIVSLCIAR